MKAKDQGQFHGATAELLHNTGPVAKAEPMADKRDKNGNEGDTVTVPRTLLEELQTRLASLEHAEAIRRELALNPHSTLLDETYSRWKQEVSRPASVRTQEQADKKYTDGTRFKVTLDSTDEQGKPGPRTDEFFPLELCAHSDLEAVARYQEIMGIKRTEHTIRAVPVVPAA